MKIQINKINGTISENINNLTKPTGSDKLLNIFKDEGKITVSVSDEVKNELGIDSNIWKTYKKSSFPMSHYAEPYTETKILTIGKNSQFQNLTDAKNYAAALIELYTEKILIIKLIDKKFTNKIYYIISDTFSDSDFLNIPAVQTADAIAGASFITNEDKKELIIEQDGEAI